MTKEELIAMCLKLPNSFLDYPFDEKTAVIKISTNGKMFAYLDYLSKNSIKKYCDKNAPVNDGDLGISLKCQPDLSEIFRHQYMAVVPAYHSNKTHWNTIVVDKDVSEEELYKMIQHSYSLVVSKTKKR